MLKLFKKAFWIECEDVIAGPSTTQVHEAIAKYCEANGDLYDFTGDHEVVIAGITHEIRCVRSAFLRGRYVIKCREK